MPISKFGYKIASVLTNYLADENPTTLDTSDAYDAVQQGVTVAAAAVGQAASYVGSFLCSKASSPPKTVQPAAPKGKAGVLRAVEIAKIFDIVSSKSGLTAALGNAAMLGDPPSRRSEITTEGFGLTQPGRVADVELTTDDCNNIITFILHKDKLHESTSGKKVIQVIQSALHITSIDINDEINELRNPTVQAGGVVQSNLSDSEAPPELRTVENAWLKVIFDRATYKAPRLRGQPIWTVSTPQSQTPSYSNSAKSTSAIGMRRPSAHSATSATSAPAHISAQAQHSRYSYQSAGSTQSASHSPQGSAKGSAQSDGNIFSMSPVGSDTGDGSKNAAPFKI